jgi:hypothetical protein
MTKSSSVPSENLCNLIDKRKAERAVNELVIAAFGLMVLCLVFQIGASKQHEIDRKEITAAYKASEPIGYERERAVKNEPTSTSQTTEISLLGVRLGVGEGGGPEGCFRLKTALHTGGVRDIKRGVLDIESSIPAHSTARDAGVAT